MKVEPHKITVRQLAKGFREGDYDEGVVGYGGNLDIRPPYQREFIYGSEQQEAVIHTALKGYPLNIMYWSDNGGGKYEVMDGQQRIISLCRFVQPGGFSVMLDKRRMTFSALPKDKQEKLECYELLVYFCTGTESEKLEWFQTINIAGEELEEQEIRNAIYCGPWVIEAKRYFSRPGRGAAHLADGYHSARVKRQELLETAIKWHCGKRDKNSICDYMSAHCQDENANALREHFDNVVEWVERTFLPGGASPRREMKGVDWGALYDAHSERVDIKSAEVEAQVAALMKLDKDVIPNRRGIFAFALDGDERHLQLRAFDEDTRSAVWEQQERKCGPGKDPWDKKNCPRDNELPFEDAQADHIKPWKDGGKTERDNCRVLCRWCNNAKRAK